MTDESAFRTALKANPTDATSRLVFADWLDEQERARDAALQRVLARPASDELRLAYATVCDREADQVVETATDHTGNLLAQGQDGKWRSAGARRQRAEFIRVQVELAQSKPYAYWQEQARKAGAPSLNAIVPHVKIMGPDADEKARVRRELVHLARREQRERELLGNKELWRALTPSPLKYFADRNSLTLGILRWCSEDGGLEVIDAEIHRGFARTIECRASAWLRCGDMVREVHPVETLTLTTMPETEVETKSGPPFTTSVKLLGREIAIVLSEREIMQARTIERGITIAIRGAIERLVKLEWPGLEIELPPILRQ